MRKAELKVGEEYEITAQPWSSPGYRWRAKANPGRVKLISLPSSPGGYYTCEYLENPYSEYPRYDGEGQVLITARSIIRPWQEVVDEHEERQAAIDMWKQLEADCEAEAYQMVKKMGWLRAYLNDTWVESDNDGNPEDGVISMEIPMSVLRGIAAWSEKYGAPQEIDPPGKSSALTEILG